MKISIFEYVLQRFLESGEEIHVFLSNGVRLQGSLVCFGPDGVLLSREEKETFVPKSSILSISVQADTISDKGEDDE